MAVTTYIIDTSCLTQAHRAYYPFDITPSFWDFMKLHFSSGTFILTNKVVDEIKKGRDALDNWVRTQLPPGIELDCHSNLGIMDHYANIMAWGNGNPQFNSLAKMDFSEFENADPFVVATALEKSSIVVSQEISAPGSIKNIKLPDVCSNFGISHIGTYDLLRTFGFTM